MSRRRGSPAPAEIPWFFRGKSRLARHLRAGQLRDRRNVCRGAVDPRDATLDERCPRPTLRKSRGQFCAGQADRPRTPKLAGEGGADHSRQALRGAFGLPALQLRDHLEDGGWRGVLGRPCSFNAVPCQLTAESRRAHGERRPRNQQSAHAQARSLPGSCGQDADDRNAHSTRNLAEAVMRRVTGDERQLRAAPLQSQQRRAVRLVEAAPGALVLVVADGREGLVQIQRLDRHLRRCRRARSMAHQVQLFRASANLGIVFDRRSPRQSADDGDLLHAELPSSPNAAFRSRSPAALRANVNVP